MTMIDEISRDLLQNNYNSSLIYFVEAGSHLYGTNTEQSDKDYMGLFLPDQLYLFKEPFIRIQHSFFRTTGDQHTRNTVDDIDMKLISVQKFLHNLMHCEHMAFDMAFSYTNERAIIYNEPWTKYIFDDPSKFIDLKYAESFLSYSINQVKKYGLRGSRIGILRKVNEYFSENSFDPESLLVNYYQKILEIANDSEHCSIEERDDGKYLKFLNRLQHPKLKLNEFVKRIDDIYNLYGDRAKQAEQNENIDWKAASHSIRMMMQVRQFLDSQTVTFPFEKSQSDFLKQIKYGELNWKEFEEYASNVFENIKKDLSKIKDFKSEEKIKNCMKCIESFYEEA